MGFFRLMFLVTSGLVVTVTIIMLLISYISYGREGVKEEVRDFLSDLRRYSSYFPAYTYLIATGAVVVSGLLLMATSYGFEKARENDRDEKEMYLLSDQSENDDSFQHLIKTGSPSIVANGELTVKDEADCVKLVELDPEQCFISVKIRQQRYFERERYPDEDPTVSLLKDRGQWRTDEIIYIHSDDVYFSGVEFPIEQVEGQEVKAVVDSPLKLQKDDYNEFMDSLSDSYRNQIGKKYKLRPTESHIYFGDKVRLSYEAIPNNANITAFVETEGNEVVRAKVLPQKSVDQVMEGKSKGQFWINVEQFLLSLSIVVIGLGVILFTFKHKISEAKFFESGGEYV